MMIFSPTRTTGSSSEIPNACPSSSTFEGHLAAMKSPDDPDLHFAARPPAFQRLPEDLFIEIVQLYVDQRTPILDLIRLTLVCQRWRTTVEGMPTLWSRITGNETVAHLRKGLEMSKQRRLDIDYEERGADIAQRIFFKEVGPHIARWKSFVAILSSGQFPLGELETKPAPVLERLHLVNNYWQVWERPVTLFGGAPAPPTLKEFRARAIRIALHPLRLGQMRSFKLEYHSLATTAEITTVLQGSPDLDKVELSVVGERYQKNLALVKDTIRLPLLTDLRIYHLPQHVALQILSNIFAPSLRTLHITLLDSEDSRNNTLLAMTSFIPTMKSMVSDALTIDVHFGGFLYTITIGELCLTFGCNGNGSNAGELAKELFDWLGSHLGGNVMDHPVTLSFDKFCQGSLCIDWLSSCVKVTKLCLWHDTDPRSARFYQGALVSLSNPDALSSTGWLLPHVEILETDLTRERNNSNLVNMISTRQTAASQPEERTPRMSPRRLREIRLSYGGNKVVDEDPPEINFMRAIRNAAVDADIYWSGVKWEE